MFSFFRHAGPLALVLALGACASSSPPPAGGLAARQQSDILAQTRWQLNAWTGANGAPQPLNATVPGQQPLTLVFTQEQGRAQLSGFSGCNHYTAPYRVVNGQLLVMVPPATTRKACPPGPMAREQAFLNGLTAITASRLDDDMHPSRLTLTLSNGEVMQFGRAQDPLVGGQTGPTKLIYVHSARVMCEEGGVRGMCYMVRDTPSQPWQVWRGDIVGFQFQPGIDYRLKVVEVRDPNAPADAAPVRWVLDSVVEQAVARP